jgi:hypothetical protein
MDKGFQAFQSAEKPRTPEDSNPNPVSNYDFKAAIDMLEISESDPIFATGSPIPDQLLSKPPQPTPVFAKPQGQPSSNQQNSQRKLARPNLPLLKKPNHRISDFFGMKKIKQL